MKLVGSGVVLVSTPVAVEGIIGAICRTLDWEKTMALNTIPTDKICKRKQIAHLDHLTESLRIAQLIIRTSDCT